jgi:hypothetical protein
MLIHMVDAQVALGAAQTENAELWRKLNHRDELNALAANVEHVEDGGFVVLKSERKKGKFVPYCPVCWGADRKVVALLPIEKGFYTCAIHKASYQTQAHRDEKQRARERARSGPRSSLDANSRMRP